jgi:hypothetical protein
MNSLALAFSTAVETITPEMARIYLSGQSRNRTPSKAIVRAYAKEMASGHWELSPQGISFDAKGNLIDGQHRMLAVVAANVPVRFIVARNVSKEVQLVLDQGAIRKLDQCAQIAGIAATASSLAILKVIRSPISNESLLKGSRSEGVKTKLALYQKYEEGILFADRRYSVKGERNIRHTTYRAIVARAFYSQDHDKLISFLKVLDSGQSDNVKLHSAALALRKLGLSNQLRGSLSDKDEMSVYRKSISALKAFIEERPLLTLLEAKSNPFLVEGLPD